MELIFNIVVFIFLMIGFYILGKKYNWFTINHSSETNNSEARIGINHLQERLMETEEENRKKAILSKIDTFLSNAQFLEPIAKWRNEKVYKYILNNEQIYEFDDFMTEQNQRIGVDEDFLCFKRLVYKRKKNL